MKANPGYKWCPTTSKPVKTPSCQPVSNPRKKVWTSPSNSTKDSTTAKKVPKTESMPQLNFAMAGRVGSQVGRMASENVSGMFVRLLLLFSRPDKDGRPQHVAVSGGACPNKQGGKSEMSLFGHHQVLCCAAPTLSYADPLLILVLPPILFTSADPLQH